MNHKPLQNNFSIESKPFRGILLLVVMLVLECITTQALAKHTLLNKFGRVEHKNLQLATPEDESNAYYWVGGTGNWSDVNHWATTSGGTSKHSEIPSSEDNVFFDANSFTAPNQTVIIDTLNANVKNLHWTGVTHHPTFITKSLIDNNYHNESLHIHGSLAFVKEMDISLNYVYFHANTTGNTIDLGGNTLSKYRVYTVVYFQGDGEYTLMSPFTATGIILSSGTLKTGGQLLDLLYFSSAWSSRPRVLDLGSSIVNVNNWETTPQGFTLIAGTSTLSFIDNSKGSGGYFSSKGLTYHNVIIRSTGGYLSAANNTFHHVTLGKNINLIEGSNTYNTLTLEPGTIVKLGAGTTQTVNSLLAAGERSNFIQLKSSEAGVQATINQTTGTVNGQYLLLKDTRAEGGAAFNAFNSSDNGNNNGWNFTAPQPNTYYWVGGTGNWSDVNHWATASGGNIKYTSLPSQIDDVIFDTHSFTAPNQTVQVNVSNANAKNMDWTGVLYHPTFQSSIINIYGSLNIGVDMYHQLGRVYLRSDEPVNTLKITGKPFGNSHAVLDFEATGEYVLQDELSINAIDLKTGIFNTNGQNVNLEWGFSANYSTSSGSLLLGSSNINVTSAWNIKPGVSVNAGTSTIHLSENPHSERGYFSGGNQTYHRVIFSGSIEVGSKNTFDSLVFEPGAIIRLPAYQQETQNVKALIANGTAEKRIKIMTSYPLDQQATIRQTSGTVIGQHLILQNIKAEGGATFYALNSEDKGNNNGWLFRKEQMIAFDSIPDITVGSVPFALTATTNSGLPVSFEVTSGPATVTGNILALTGIGAVTVKAIQAGNDTYAPAITIRMFTVLEKQNPDAVAYNLRFGGSKTDRFTVVIKTNDGGYLAGGYSDSGISGDKSQASKGGYDYWIVKTDKNGTKQWNKTFGGTGHDYLNRIISTQDGGYLLGGSSTSNISGDKMENSRGSQDYWIVKITETGEKEWDKTYGGSGLDDLRKVNQLATGEYILAGTSDSPASSDKSQGRQGGKDYWVVKISSNGSKIWDKRYGGNSDDYLETFAKTSDGGFLLAGYSASDKSGQKSQASKGSRDYWLVKIDGAGRQLWDKAYGGSGRDELYSIGRTGTGGFFVAGYSASGISGDKTQASQGGSDYWMLLLNQKGEKLWDRSFGGNGEETLRSIIQTKEGGYILAGSSDSNISGDKTQASQGSTDYWIVKTDATGTKIWDRRFGGSNAEELRFIQRTNDGGYLLGGRSDSGISGDRVQPSQGATDYWFVKVPANGGPVAEPAVSNLVARVGSETEKAATAEVGLKAYPNPFRNKVAISFTLLQDQPVTVKVYNSQGREVSTLYQGPVRANIPCRVEWQPQAQQATGVYIIRMQGRNNSSYQKVLFAR